MTNCAKASFVEKRCTDRIAVPKGTTALFRNSKNHRNAVYVRDISEVGMLIYDNSPENRYHVDSFINDIFVNIPNKAGSGGLIVGSKVVCLFVNQAKVVRYCPDHTTYTTCYGVSFLGANKYIKEKISNIINNHV